MESRAYQELPDGRGKIEGWCRFDFQAVQELFAQNFSDRQEVGASVAVTLRGETVVDLWGGLSDLELAAPWAEDTISNVYSTSKSVLGLVANIMIDRGVLDLRQPVMSIWPEFGANGKENATCRMALDHTIGLPALRAKVRKDGFYDWEYVCDLLAREEPFWTPGTQVGYHGLTSGWIIGEMLRRVSGKSVGQLIQELLAEPLGIDVWCGLPEELETRVARMIPQPIGEHYGKVFETLNMDKASVQALSLYNDGGWINGFETTPETGRTNSDSLESHAAQIPAANVVTNARSLAQMFQPFANGGSQGGVKFVGADTLAGMQEVSAATNVDLMTLQPTAWSIGFHKMRDIRIDESAQARGVALGRSAFGHIGAGGSIAFADPEQGLSFAYTMNRMSQTGLIDERGRSLVDAVYKILGCSEIRAGYRVGSR